METHKPKDEALEAMLAEKYEEGKKWGMRASNTSALEQECQMLRKTVEQYEKARRDFEERSGILLQAWDAGHIGGAVRQYMYLMEVPKVIDRIATNIEQQNTALQKAAAEIRALQREAGDIHAQVAEMGDRA